jgi:hypothetical protein
MGLIGRLLDKWKDKPQREGARTLLHAEVDVNLGLLKAWWGKIKPRKSEDEIHWVDKVVYARELADAPVPDFALDGFKRYQPSLSQYLRGDQLKRLAQFYQDLGKLAEIQQELRAALEKDIALRRSLESQPGSGRKPSPTFDNFLSVAPWSWREAARLIDAILTRGNPLRRRGEGTKSKLVT